MEQIHKHTSCFFLTELKQNRKHTTCINIASGIYTTLLRSFVGYKQVFINTKKGKISILICRVKKKTLTTCIALTLNFIFEQYLYKPFWSTVHAVGVASRFVLMLSMVLCYFIIIHVLYSIRTLIYSMLTSMLGSNLGLFVYSMNQWSTLQGRQLSQNCPNHIKTLLVWKFTRSI